MAPSQFAPTVSILYNLAVMTIQGMSTIFIELIMAKAKLHTTDGARFFLRTSHTIAFCMCALISQHGFAQSGIIRDGVTRPSERLATFEEVFNSDDERVVEQFVEDNFTDVTAAKLKRLQGFIRMLSEDFEGIRVAETHDLKDGTEFVAGHVVVQTKKKGEWKNIQFFTDNKQEGRFTSIAIADAIEPRKLPDGNFSDPGMQQWLDDHVERLHRQRHLSGAFLVAKNGRILYQKTCGWENYAKRRSVSTSTPFNLASGGKMFTAIAIAQLAEQQKLGYDDSISKHLPDYANQKVANSVTIRQLLTHTSGLPEYWTVAYEKDWDQITKLRQIMPYFIDQDLKFNPGSKHEYCNTNYILLGLIIESVGKIDYFDFIQENVFERAGMKHSGFFEVDDSKSRFAKSYEFVLPGTSNSKAQWHTAKLGRKGSSAGGCYASAEDMLQFDIAFSGGKLLPESATKMITTGKVKQPVGGMYCFGFMEGSYQSRRWFGHGGTGPGSFFEYMHFPDSGYTIVMFANHDGTAAYDIFRKLQQLVARSN